MEAPYYDELARFVTQARWENLPREAQHAAKRVCLDSLGAIMLGSEEPENANLGKFFVQWSAAERTSTLLRAGFPQVDRFSAAFVNGTQAPSVELDDGYRYITAHCGAYITPGAMAMAEAADASIAEMLTALAIGYDISARTARAAPTPRLNILQHGVVTAMGNAAVACLLQGYDEETTREALKIAAGFAHVTSFDILRVGATVRNLWVGLGARDGLMAPELARMGFLGHPDGIRITTERIVPALEPKWLTSDLGKVYCISQNHHKAYACCTGFFASVEATLDLVRSNDLAPEQIERILVDVYPPYETTNVAHPRNSLAAKFSLSYAIAAAAACRHADHEAFLPDKLRDPAITGLAERTELRRDDSMAARMPDIRPSRVTFQLRDGRTLVKLAENPRGHFKDPFTDEELETKFARLAGHLLTEEGVALAREYIKSPEKGRPVRELTEAFRAHSKAPA